MPTGVPYSAIPSWGFAFPRSYFYQILVSDQSPNITRVGDYIHTNIDHTIGYGIWYKINPKMFTWNSNSYTLDHVVEDCWWEYNFDSVHHPQAYCVNWISYGSPPVTTLEIQNPFLVTDRVLIPVAQAPSNYWTPTP